jgi:hypothetical protein
MNFSLFSKKPEEKAQPTETKVKTIIDSKKSFGKVIY